MNAMIMDYSPKQKLCLCCETILNNEKNVVEHVMSKKHKNAAVCKKDIVQVYLDFWGSEKRKEQKYYLPYDLNKFRCMECRHSVNLSAIVPHAAECIPTLSEAEPTMYKDSVKNALYPTSKTFKECVFQKRNKLLFCLYCCATLQGSTEDHCKVPSHLKNINNSNKIKMVEAYHNYWKHKSEEMQLSQICFSPSNSRTVECNWCERFFTFQELKGHNCLNLKIGDFKLLTGQLSYCSEVMETVYPHDNFEVQVSNKKYLCLFCNVDATGTLDWHLAGKSHRKKIRNKERVQAVVRYHRFWMSKGNELQMNQLKYRPFNHQCMECVQCNLVHGWDVLMKHKCDVPSQTVKKMRYGADIMRTVYHHMTMCDAMDTFVVQRIDANLYNCLHCRMTFSESVSEHCKSVRHKAKAKLNLWMSALNAYHSYWLNSKTPMDQIYYTTHSHVNMRCLRCEDVVFFNDVLPHECSPTQSAKTQNKTVYCYEVLFSIYSHLESERMEDLFIQKIDDKTYHCLHCAIQIRRNWDKHAKTHAHSGRIDSNDEFISKSVSRYHKFWVSGSSPAVQLMQTKYFPYDMENGTCVWCDSILPYNETMIKHKCVESSDSSGSNSSDDEDEEDAEVLTMLERKDEVLLQRYKGPSKLHNLVRSVLYPHNLCQLVSNSHLKLHFPIFHNRIMKIRCLLCTKDIDKTEKDVINHLKNYHGQFTSRLFTQAIHVIAYHKHFEKQPIDKHYLQSYFMPAGTRTANCLRLHNVEYSKLEHHYVKCAKRSDKTLEGSMKKFTNPNLIQGAGKVFHEMVIVPKGRFPVRLQYQSEFFRMEAEPSKKVYCKYCEIDLESFSDALLHLAEEKHSVLLKSKEKYMYVCDMCCYKTHREIDWQKHFSSTGHQNMYKSIGEIRQTTLHEFECKICAYVLYGDELSVFDHKEGLAALKPNKKIKNREQSDKKLRKIFGNEESTELFLEERQVECELVGSPAVQLCLQDIKEQLKTKYPHCKVFPFGSRAIEIGDSNSDLDVFADLKSNYFGGAQVNSRA
ncbi:PREDICTED: uncharacterized protein LOC108558015 isoform X2 [Nicrophorus vespilloides]|nr:PREDICTED: uncharacterized protein LOC108558015 isoform X2 [Nicrophorus vespilloides]